MRKKESSLSIPPVECFTLALTRAHWKSGLLERWNFSSFSIIFNVSVNHQHHHPETLLWPLCTEPWMYDTFKQRKAPRSACSNKGVGNWISENTTTALRLSDKVPAPGIFSVVPAGLDCSQGDLDS